MTSASIQNYEVSVKDFSGLELSVERSFVPWPFFTSTVFVSYIQFHILHTLGSCTKCGLADMFSCEIYIS
jgi:hypothetical protein